MDRLTQLRGEAGGSRDSTLDTSSPPSEAYMTANESSSKYFSLSEEDSTFDISPIKDVSLASAADPEKTITDTDELISNISPIPKKNDLLDSYKIGKQIEAANILSGGVDIFDDNDNSYDGNELVIDDNVEIDDKSNPELKLAENAELPFQKSEEMSESSLVENETIASKDTEVVLQIDGKNVNAIDIGNGLYLYRKEGEEELAAVQIVDDDQQQPNFKFLKVRENAEGNLEVYEEIEIEVPKEVPVKEVKTLEKNSSHVPIKDINKVISDPTCNKVAERKNKSPLKEISPATSSCVSVTDSNADVQSEPKTEFNLNGKMTKFNETRKSPVIHSTPNKEGIPLTKTMVDLQLHPNRHSDNVKTIEVHTDVKHKQTDSPAKSKDTMDENKTPEVISDNKDKLAATDKTDPVQDEKNQEVKEPEKNIVEKEQKEGDKNTDTLENVAPEKKCTQEDKISTTDENLGKDVIENKKQDTEKGKIKENIVETSNQDSEAIVEQKKEIVEDGNKKEDKCKDIKIDASQTSSVDLKESELVKTTPDKDTDLKDTSTLKVPEGEVNDQVVVAAAAAAPTVNTNVVEEKTTLQIPKSEMKKVEAFVDKESNHTLTAKDTLHKKQEFGKDSVDSSTESTNNFSNKNTSTITIEGKDTVIESSTETSKADEKVVVSKPNKGQESLVEIKQTVLDEKITQISVQDAKQIIAKKTLSDVKEPATNKNVKPVSEQILQKEIKPIEQVALKNTIPECLTKLKEDVSKKEIPIKEKCEVEIAETHKIDKVPKPDQKIKDKLEVKQEVTNTNAEQKPVNNIHAAVPFGKWTEANRQEFLNKIKESKIPTNTCNTNQLKQPNDLNRRDVLQKIDSQRERQSNNAMAKAHELNAKHNVKNETKSFATKSTVSNETKVPVKTEVAASKNKPVANKNLVKPEATSKAPKERANTTSSSSSSSSVAKKEPTQRKEINNQDLIDKTIEGIINRALPAKPQEDIKQDTSSTVKIVKETTSFSIKYQPTNKDPTSLDAIEMKMNELHGIPFVERPPHELPHVYNHDVKTFPKTDEPKAPIKVNKVPNLVPYANKNQSKVSKDNIVEVDSEEEIIEHEPITGDIEPKVSSKVPVTETAVTQVTTDSTKKEPIITEKDFDKFARRNSITYENCLTVNFEGNQPHNVIQTVIEKDIPPKKYSRNEMLLAEAKTKSSHKQLLRPNKHPSKIQITSKLMPVGEDAYNKNYQSKLQIAYQSALTTKRHMESPITIIEDKPVKVVFMESNSEFMPSQLNVQGNQLSPVKKKVPEIETFTVNDSLDSDILEMIDDGKSQDEYKVKTKHQRKQVLTPVETPELELIEPNDLALGVEVSPKKKRRTEDNKADKHSKNLVPKKTYLLGRSTVVENKEGPAPQDLTKNPLKETVNQINAVVSHKDAASAIDNLVKAAELLETQSENLNTSTTTVNSDTPQATPVKRGRGRPRKYPLPDGVQDTAKTPTPQKKPRLIDAKKPKQDKESNDEDTSDDEVIKENWTMGKINENIVCPICSKLFRSENVVFKHVKHCTGPSPNRSDSDTRRSRFSRESESKSRGSKSDDTEVDTGKTTPKRGTPKKRRSKELASESGSAKDKVITIEDSPSTEKLEIDEPKQHVSRKTATKAWIPQRASSLKCEICGKTFRQLSYLVSHKLQHKKEEKKTENDTQTRNTVFSCEVCKKEFRKLHHLAQHRIIHNPSSMSSRSSRKSSSEQNDKRVTKDNDASKQSDDQSAAFRCEPCDKSFRKLHHLVEHRETHDGIKRQKNITTTQADLDKIVPTEPPQCDICKKTFRKLHHLIDHKEQHVETSSEKSDDKSVKSSLSTRDIIHECSLCYMVFPNEHSLNKHSVFCQRKKRQSAVKKQTVETDATEESNETSKPEESDVMVEEPEIEILSVVDEKIEPEQNKQSSTVSEPPIVENITEVAKIIEKRPSKEIEVKPVEAKSLPHKRNIEETVDCKPKTVEVTPEIDINKDQEKVRPAKIKKIEEKTKKEEVIKTDDTPKKRVSVQDDTSKKRVSVQDDTSKKRVSVQDGTPKKRVSVQDGTPKKRVSVQDKTTATVTKRQKSANLPPPIVDEKPIIESSDDDEVRYMLNPDFKVENNIERKFMKVKAKKRNSLQIERPKSVDLDKRRTSLQHPPKIPRLKPKPIETRNSSTNTATVKHVAKTPKLEPVPSTDSDDSDVKYSFPKTVAPKTPKTTQDSKPKEVKTPTKERRKTIVEKRKSLVGIAKRKSLGKAVTAKHKVNPSPTKQVKRRTTEVEHRCDCGQLFSSAAMLSRHTTLAHTPPRIRRRRSPPPEVTKPTTTKPRKTIVSEKPKTTDSRKSSVKSETSNPNAKSTRTSNVDKEPKILKTRKSKGDKVEAAKSAVKVTRSGAHRGVPVPDKMRKLLEKKLK